MGNSMSRGGASSPVLHTVGQGFESRLCQGLSLAGSRWSDIIGSSLRGRGEDLATYISALQAPRAQLRQSGERMRLGEGVSLYGIARSYWGLQGRGVFGGSNSMGGRGVIEEMWV